MELSELSQLLGPHHRLQNLSLRQGAWPEEDAAGSHFSDCAFAHVQFTNAPLEGATFERCRFAQCRFSHALLREASFIDCQFIDPDAKQKGVVFAFSDLRSVRFDRSDLSFSEFDRSDAHAFEASDCNFIGARFHKVDFGHALSRRQIINKVSFRRCNLELAELADLRLAQGSFTGSRLREANLRGSDCEGTDFSGCDLFQALIEGAQFHNADLRSAEISGLCLSELASYQGLRITLDQQYALLTALGLNVE